MKIIEIRVSSYTEKQTKFRLDELKQDQASLGQLILIFYYNI